MKAPSAGGEPVHAANTSPSDEVVVEGLRSVIEAVLRRVLGANDPEYEDVLQNSLERVIATLDQDTFRGECPLAVWAALIARKVAADALRVRYRERRVFVRDDTMETSPGLRSLESGPEMRIEARERLQQFANALSGLRVGRAQVVFMHSVLGYQLAEIAAMIGISVTAAQSRLVRGRREIVSRLGH